MNFSQIVQPLLRWYAGNGRPLPWRDDPTPYRVWISEIMLQQTRIQAVLPYFERFMREIPDIPSLAAVPEEKLLKLWEGLGYYSRARNLQKTAKLVMEQFGGSLPADAVELKKLPGIGDYTAGAVSSIAFGRPEPAVDGNVLRVMARLAASREDIAASGVKQRAAALLREVYPKQNAGAFTQALMELGETVCLPNGEPRCGVCPLAPLCLGYKTGQASSLPVRSPKPERRVEQKTVFVIRSGGLAALRQRPGSGLLARMWELPNAEGALSPEQACEQIARWGLTAETIEKLPPAKHVFTHVEWRMQGYAVRVPQAGGEFVWVQPEAVFGQYALPSAFKSFLRFLKFFI